ncbi:hypothetical protein J7E88_12640 [Streptomyces sp. ISL-10]|uniref:hypothetical protein n=1 Tax=Streptomyces sp. ISL-10 TaxID=2819172 RepID=UPI001BEC30F6|nr:hypothetical protein [Streptomyces sp. ISL-10]MBT2366132.1 hypothetical protein [Streptomyces sp. ISL-10]
MAGVAECPSCGEDEELRGEPCAGDIRVTCLSCGAQWMRGAPRCAGCGGQDIVQRPQSMTRHSRGTQLSIIGWREVPLCRTCDAEVLETSIAQNTPVPGDYVSNCLYGSGERPAVPQSAPPPAPARPPSPPSAPAPSPRESPRQPAAVPAGPRAERSRPRPAPSAVPTVRQAIAAFLAEASGEVDHTAMLLLGTHLGSYERLGVLDAPDAADALAAWCEGHWGDCNGAGAQRAVSTILRAVDFWGARGWLASDPAAKLRRAGG